MFFVEKYKSRIVIKNSYQKFDKSRKNYYNINTFIS